MSQYFSIQDKAEGFYKEKGSKFYAFAIPVDSLEAIENQLISLRSKYHDARHHCYAWRLGTKHLTFRANDDGEPNHSAGDPILGQLKAHSLTNTLIVVVRYFGGTKLGVGGLIAAYKTAAKSSIEKAITIKVFDLVSIQLNFPYDIISEVEQILSKFEIKVRLRDYQEVCRVSGQVKENLLEEFKLACNQLYQLKTIYSNETR